MSIVITCPKCHYKLEALDEHAGMKASCANCNTEFEIPGEIKLPNDVMISYSTKDKQMADAACFMLEKNGIRCWIAPRDITPGKEWGEAIVDAIGESRVMLLIFSSNSDHSQQVRREVERASAKAKPIIPFRIENVPPSKAMEYFLCNTHWLDAFTGNLEKHLENMVRTIQVLLQAGEVKEAPEIPAFREIRQGGKAPAFKFSRSTAYASAIVMGILSWSFVVYYFFFTGPASTKVAITGKSPSKASSKEEAKVPAGFVMLKPPAPDTDGWASEIHHKDTGLEMIYVAPGEFMMGSPWNEPERGENETQHKVKLTKGYYIGKYEVTQEQWGKVTGNNPSDCKDSGKNAPVEHVDWNDCQLFCQKLAHGFRLPTAAEWEYAARGGNKSKGFIFSGSNNPGEVAWDYNGPYKTHPVGQKKPNELGIYDMSGNVWEWVADWYGNYPTETVTDPTGPEAGTHRVMRGGGIYAKPADCRSANLDGVSPQELSSGLGFRLVLDISIPESKRSAEDSGCPPAVSDNNSSTPEALNKKLPSYPEPVLGKDWTVPDLMMEFVWIKVLNCWVGKYEVTNGEYRKLFDPEHDSGEYYKNSLEGDRQPVVNISYTNILKYAKWLTERERKFERLPSGYTYRLPTDKEWTAFCQCGDNREYPWGSGMPPKYGNYFDKAAKNVLSAWDFTENKEGYILGYDDGFAVTCSVERSGKNDWGLYGVGGNVWEPTCKSPTNMSFDNMRGASIMISRSATLRSDFRLVNDSSFQYDKNDGDRQFGFRLILGTSPVESKMKRNFIISPSAPINKSKPTVSIQPISGPVTGSDWTVPDIAMEFVWIKVLNCWVGKYEVTNEEYRKFNPDHNSMNYDDKYSLNEDRQPVTYVNFEDASEYARWLTVHEGKIGRLPTGYIYRLPTGKEWTVFAQCGDNRKYPWGNEWPPKYGNYLDQTAKDTLTGTSFPNLMDEENYVKGYEDGAAVTAPVEKSGKNDWGLYGVGGNVWEFTCKSPSDRSCGAWYGASWVNGKPDPIFSSSRRDTGYEHKRFDVRGFRLVLARYE